MFSVGTAATVTPSKKDRLNPGTKSFSYGKIPASQLICRPSGKNFPKFSSGRARTSWAVMPEWMTLRYMWYTRRGSGIGRRTHSCWALMIA